VTIGNGITYLSQGMFDGCSLLTTVTIPSSVTYIDTGAFEGCVGLTSATFLGNAPTMGSGVFNSNVTSLPLAGFQVEYYNGATGFTSPNWTDSSTDIYPAVNLGNSPYDVFGGVSVGGGLEYSSWFGYYLNGSYPLVYHYYLGYEYVFPAGSGVYLYDYPSGHFFYTQSNYFPYVYDFSLNTFLYYYAAPTPHRHFYDYGTGAVITE